MAILIDEKTQVIVQGITGTNGRRLTKLMLDMGSKIVAGVTPGKGGQVVESVPVFDTVYHAKEKFPEADATFICVPASTARSSALEAIDAGVRVLVLHAERVPLHDVMDIIDSARQAGAWMIGPNTIGILSPGKCLVGSQGAKAEYARKIFLEGPCGVISRSGGQTTTLCYYLSRRGIGASTVVSTGGDAILGTTWKELLHLFEQDKETKAVVAFGEIGTNSEEDAAELLRSGEFTKPFIVYVAGRYAMPEMRFGHAGAIIYRGSGTAAAKMDLLRDAGAIVVDSLSEIGDAAAEALKEEARRK